MNEEVLICSACGDEIFRHHARKIESRVSVPSRANVDTGAIFQQMLEESDSLHYELVVMPAEEACHAHMASKHPVRYRLWQRFRKDWLLRKWLVR